MKNYIKNLLLLIVCLFAVVTVVACNDNEGGPDFPYDDMIERPNDIPPLADLEYVSYPEKPTNISAGQGSGMPIVGIPTTDSEHYKITEEEGKITVKFYSRKDT